MLSTVGTAFLTCSRSDMATRWQCPQHKQVFGFLSRENFGKFQGNNDLGKRAYRRCNVIGDYRGGFYYPVMTLDSRDPCGRRLCQMREH